MTHAEYKDRRAALIKRMDEHLGPEEFEGGRSGR